jgi:LPXTG-motif cell wall-anchored protein
MTFIKRYSQTAFTFAVSTLILAGLATQAAAAPTLPTLPTGDILKVVSFFDPKQVATVDVTTGVATVDPATTGFSTLQESEGAGFEVSTGKTWLLDGTNCSLWLLNEDGTTTELFDLPDTTELTNLDFCWALMLQQDGTAYVTGEGTNGATLIRVNLSDGSLVEDSEKDTDAYISGLSRDPSTGVVWASVISSESYPPGLYIIDVQTGQLDLSSQILQNVYSGQNAWDITFDSSGRLWMVTFDDENKCTLVSLDPDAADPSLTFFSVAEVLSSNNVSFGSDAIWIPGVGTIPASAPAATTTPKLATTGANVEWLMFAGLITATAGASFLTVSRRKRTA